MNTSVRQGKRRWGIAQLLGINLTLILGAFFLLLALFLLVRIDAYFQSVRTSDFMHKAEAVNAEIKDDLQRHVRLLRDHAAFPLIVQTTLQPKTNLKQVRHLMESLNFLGQSHQEILLDFRGEVINRTDYHPDFNYRSEPWLAELSSGAREHYLGISQWGDTHFWRLAVPVHHQELVEGFLVLELPIGRESFGHHFDIAEFSMEITSNGRTILEYGRPSAEEPLVIDGPVPGVQLRFYQNDQEWIQLQNRLLGEILLLTLLGLLLIFILTLIVGRKWLVEPIRLLQEKISGFSENLEVKEQSSEFAARELYQLNQDFQEMASLIKKREDELVEKNTELTDLHRQVQSSQAKLIQSEKMASLGTLAAGVAHEINNPIGFIKNNLVSLVEYFDTIKPAIEKAKAANIEFEGDIDFILEDIDPLMEDTLDGSRRVEEIVSGLKRFARAGETKNQDYDLNQCIEDTLKVVWNELKYKAEVEKVLGDLPSLYGNPGEVNQVIMNLLVNAGQAIEKQGNIRIETSRDGDYALLKVTDTGRGISEENLPKLFTPFFTTKEIGKGTGLGLSISHGIVIDQGGRINVESTPGEGTCFSVWLPLSDSEEG
jgi:two-component system NtrC family sensor kinase